MISEWILFSSNFYFPTFLIWTVLVWDLHEHRGHRSLIELCARVRNDFNSMFNRSRLFFLPFPCFPPFSSPFLPVSLLIYFIPFHLPSLLPLRSRDPKCFKSSRQRSPLVLSFPLPVPVKLDTHSFRWPGKTQRVLRIKWET